MITEKSIDSSDLIQRLRQILEEIYLQGSVCRIILGGQEGCVLGLEKIFGCILDLVDEEYW
jgi:hypothetical protein